jgi:hypothetical protein
MMEKFSKLPPWIEYEGISFELRLINNGHLRDNRLVYAIDHVAVGSQHHNTVAFYGCWNNPFLPGAGRGFLVLVENIATDDHLIEAIDEVKEFLVKNKLYDDPSNTQKP